MNKTRKIIISLSIACCAACAAAACATPDATIPDLIAGGTNIVVEFDQNGGIVASLTDVYVKDFYSYDQVEKGVRLMEPGDSKRGDSAASSSAVTREGYFIIGWYRERAPRVDEQGNALDENGELVSETGNRQGYVYSGRWDFNADTLTLDEESLVEDTETYGKTVYKLTLYAAWSPRYTYEFYYQNGNEWASYGSVALPNNMSAIPTPKWNEEAGALSYDINEYTKIPVYKTSEKNYSMTGLYGDPGKSVVYGDDNMENTVITEIPHPGSYDLTNGTAENTIVRLYTTWREGLWYKATTPANFKQNLADSGGAGIFDVMADIDFTKVEYDEEGNEKAPVSWTAGLSSFSGTINGKGHKIIGPATTQADYNTTIAGGVFGTITANAVIKDVAFENVTFTINSGTNRAEDRGRAGGYYGLLAGEVEEGATLQGVTVSGEIHVGNPYAEGNYKNYVIGYICGNVVGNAAVANISAQNIKVVVDWAKIGYDVVTWDDINGWAVIATDNGDGTVNLTKNDKPEEFNPNLTEN